MDQNKFDESELDEGQSRKLDRLAYLLSRRLTGMYRDSMGAGIAASLIGYLVLITVLSLLSLLGGSLVRIIFEEKFECSVVKITNSYLVCKGENSIEEILTITDVAVSYQLNRENNLSQVNIRATPTGMFKPREVTGVDP